jgi:hypothetical protein
MKLGDLTTTDKLQLTLSGVGRDFNIGHQGNPNPAMYDVSFNDGTIVFSTDVLETRQWNSSNVNDYQNSTINPYLNNDFINALTEKDIVKTVKIPYRPGSSGAIVNSGANGLSVKTFLLSGREVGSGAVFNYADEGTTLSYFAGIESTADSSQRIAMFNGTPASWWLRTPDSYTSSTTVLVADSGYTTSAFTYSSQAQGIRSALVLPRNLRIKQLPSGQYILDLSKYLVSFSNLAYTHNGLDWASLGKAPNALTEQDFETPVDPEKLTAEELGKLGSPVDILTLSDSTPEIGLKPGPQIVVPLSSMDLSLAAAIKQVTAQDVGGEGSLTLGSLTATDKLQLTVSGNPTNFNIGHQGNPDPALYDVSFNDGTIVFSTDVLEKRQWGSNSDYANSSVNAYLNNDFINTLTEKDIVKDVKVPYRRGSGTGLTVNSGPNGLSVKAFLPSAYEVNSPPNIIDGALWSYFSLGGNSTRIAYLNGSAVWWWLRTPSVRNTSYVCAIYINGEFRDNFSGNNVTSANGIRPALVLPQSTPVKFITSGIYGLDANPSHNAGVYRLLSLDNGLTWNTLTNGILTPVHLTGDKTQDKELIRTNGLITSDLSNITTYTWAELFNASPVKRLSFLTLLDSHDAKTTSITVLQDRYGHFRTLSPSDYTIAQHVNHTDVTLNRTVATEAQVLYQVGSSGPMGNDGLRERVEGLRAPAGIGASSLRQEADLAYISMMSGVGL